MNQTPFARSQTQSLTHRDHDRDSEDCPHRNNAPCGEGRRGPKQKCINDIGRTCDPKPGDVDHDCRDQRGANPTMDSPCLVRRKTGKISANQQRLKHHERERKDPRQTGHDVDRLPPFKERAECRGSDRHCYDDDYGKPDQADLKSSHAVEAVEPLDRLKNKVCLKTLIFGARHYGTEKDGFKFATVVGQVTMRLAEGGNDLRHFKTKMAVLVG